MKKVKYIVKKISKLFFIIFISIFIYSLYMSLQAEEKTPSIIENRPKDFNNNSIEDILDNNINSVCRNFKIKR